MRLNQRLYTPDDPGQGGQPNPTPSAASTAVVPEFVKTKFGGDVKKAEEGFWQLTNYASNVKTEADALKAENARLKAALGGPPAPQNMDPLAKVAEEWAVPVESLRGAIASEVTQAVQQVLKPALDQFGALEQLKNDVPNFDQIKKPVEQWLGSNPSAKADFETMVNAGLTAQAWKLAIANFAAANPQKGGLTPSAGLPGGMAPANRGGSGGSALSQPDPAALDLATAYFKEQNDPRPMVHERLKGTSVEKAIAAQAEYLGSIGGSL